MAAGASISWCCATAILLVAVVVLSWCESIQSEPLLWGRKKDHYYNHNNYDNNYGDGKEEGCEEIYVVREGETVQSISEKCGDPFIVEENPHINDPDDVFPGLVIKITPSFLHQRYRYQYHHHI